MAHGQGGCMEAHVKSEWKQSHLIGHPSAEGLTMPIHGSMVQKIITLSEKQR